MKNEQTSDTLARYDGQGRLDSSTTTSGIIPREVWVAAITPPGSETVGETPRHIQDAFAGDPQANFAHVGPTLIYDRSTGSINISPVEDPDPGKHVFKSGAARSKLMSWFSFVPRYFIQRIADVFRYGAKKYGLRNWQKGDQEFIDEIPDHIINHVYAYVEEVNNGGDGKSTEDHLANIGCNLVMLMHYQRQGKYPTRTQG